MATVNMVKIRSWNKRQGQGMPEYAVLLAFVAAVALLVLGTNNTFSAAVNAAFAKAAASLNGL